MIKLLFQLIAAALVGFAAYSFWQGNTEAAFVSVALAAVSYLLRIRFQIKARLKERQAVRAKDALPK